MRPTRIHRTATFKLASLIALLFSTLTAIQFAIVYWDFSSFARAQLQSTIEHEAQQLAKEAEEEGVAHLTERLRGALVYTSGRAFEYAIFDPTGHRVLGGLAIEPGQDGWSEVDISGGAPGDGDERAVAFGRRLVDGSLLVVARDTDVFVDLRERVAQTLSAGAALTVLLALLGGAIISRRSLRRVDEINQTVSRIMTGDLAQRLPNWGAEDEFDRLSDILNRMLQRIERLMLDIRHVSSDIAHDLRTPLARLRQGLEALSQEASTPEAFQTGIDKSLAEVDGVLETFAALLRIAEVEAGARAAGFKELDLSSQCQGLVDTYAAVVEDSGRSLSSAIEPGLIVRGDPELLAQAIANLIENALRHTPAGSRISMTLSLIGPDACLVIADDGPGIPEAAHEIVLGRFTRLDASRAAAGHGLGLALVASIAELHGAVLSLGDNRPGLRVGLSIPAIVKVN